MLFKVFIKWWPTCLKFKIYIFRPIIMCFRLSKMRSQTHCARPPAPRRYSLKISHLQHSKSSPVCWSHHAWWVCANGVIRPGDLAVYLSCKSYCNTVHFRRITSIHQPTNAHIISHKTLLKHSDMFRSCQIIIRELFSLLNLYHSIKQFISYLQTRCCGSISCCVGMCCGAVARCASYDSLFREG